MATLDLGNVMGPQGPQGSIWYFGTDITGTNATGTAFPDTEILLARLYDKYLNTATGNVYTCVSEGDAKYAQWAYIGNIKGPAGNIGPVGPTGSVDVNTPIEFTEADTLANIESGESVSVIFGKLKKIVGSILQGAASTLLGNNLTASRALTSDADGKVVTSNITTEELGYLDGLTGNLQDALNQLNEKMRAGTLDVTGLETTSKPYTVTFDTPMQDTNYSISLNPNFVSYYDTLNYAIYEKRIDGFTVRVSNTHASSGSVTYVFDWIVIAN